MNIREKMIEAIAVRLSLRAGHGVNNVSDFWRAQADEILTDLEPMIRALSAPEPGEAEPVAWQVTLPMGREDEDGGGYLQTTIATNPEFVKTLDPVRNKVEPLYASPITPPLPAGSVVSHETAVDDTQQALPITDDSQASPAVTDTDGLDGPTEQEIDRLRLKAFQTNNEEDNAAYFNAASKWFQDRHYRRLATPVSPTPATVEALATIKQWHDWAFKWSGTAFIADEALPLDAMTDAEHKAELYSDLCKLGNHMAWLHDQVAALSGAPAGWRTMESAPKDKHILLDIGETIPDLVDARAGRFISESDAAELGDSVSASGGWMIWNTGSDWFIIPYHDAHGWMPLPSPLSVPATQEAGE